MRRSSSEGTDRVNMKKTAPGTSIPIPVWHPVSTTDPFLIWQRDACCALSRRCYKPCRFFKKEDTLYDWMLFGFFSFCLSGPSPFISSFALNFACAIRSLHLSNAISFNFTIFLSISPAICRTSGKLSMCVIHQGIDILSDRQLMDRIVICCPPFGMCDRIAEVPIFLSCFPG